MANKKPRLAKKGNQTFNKKGIATRKKQGEKRKKDYPRVLPKGLGEERGRVDNQMDK